MFKAVWSIVFFLFSLTSGFALTEEPAKNDTVVFKPNEKPTLEIPRAAGAIIIDGKMDDPGWLGAAKAENFSETFPEEKGKPRVNMHVLVTYDDTNFYMAFFVEDDPGKIRASLRDRDEMWQDDYVGILLDTYGDASNAFFIFSNPLGIQGDSRFSSSGGEDDSYDLIYQSAGRITESGYQVEMAIPFRSLRFPDREEQTWRATFWITHPRDSRRTYSWAAMDRDNACFLCQYGTLTGIRGIRPGKKAEFLPSIVGNQAGELRNSDDPTKGFNNQKIHGDVGLGVKYSFSSNLTADLALNPDFSQVESDVAQIDVNSTFALFFPERRPFFQEGSDLFDTWINAVYTRSINNPIAAGKLTGTFNKTNLAYIGGVDENTPFILPFEEQSEIFNTSLRSTSNIFRVKQSLYGNSHIGALLTDRRVKGGSSGSVFGLDGQFQFFKRYRLELQYVMSRTKELDDPGLSAQIADTTFDAGKHTTILDGESYWGNAIYASLERDARFWNFDFDYWEYSPTFRADNGFETGNNLRRTTFWTGLNFWQKNSKIFDRISPSISFGRIWNFDGIRKERWIQPQLSISMKAQTSVWLSYMWNPERFAGTDFSGIQRFMLNVNSNFSDPVRLGFFASKGRRIRRSFSDPSLGESTTLEVWATIKPSQRFVIQPNFTYSKLDSIDGGPNFFDGFILRTRLNYQFTREFFLRVVVQYNDFSKGIEFDPLLTYRLNAFTAFFIGSTLDYQSDFENVSGYKLSSRQYFLKFQYLYQL